ncbi:hypothetical protein [uncultured Anaerococcus sp.]|uniref:hypothetical protein n=1 Tax=uncultured Anaerococcus sp. TaxID=293428 RepID=UPI0025EE60F1|nr:hypothetical protein [uncultured Anaerococcus sp.]
MKKILSILLAAALIIGFINYRENNRPKSIEKNDRQIEDALDDKVHTKSCKTNRQDNNIENQKSDIENNDLSTGIEYVKNNEFNDLSDDEKAKIYAMASDGLKQMGYDTNDFTYDDLNKIYDACQEYIIENNVDADSLSLVGQAKLYNILKSYIQNDN